MFRLYSDGDYIYSIDLMIKYVNQPFIKTKRIKLNKITEINLDEDIWTTETLEHVTPREVLRNPNISLYHFNKIKKCDLCFPIIVNEKNEILDGMHRMVKAILENKEYIKIYILKEDIIKNCIILDYIDEFSFSLAYEFLGKEPLDDLFNKRF